MCRDRVLLWTDVGIKCFFAVTEFGQDQEFLCHDKIFLCYDRVGQSEEKLCHDKVFLCRDRVWSFPRVFMS